MSGELKVDKISSSTNGTTVEVDGSLKVDEIIPESILTIKGTLNAEGPITGPTIDALLPVGSILPYEKSFPNTPDLSAHYAECDGSIIIDTDSVYNGYRSRNLNGADIELIITWIAGTGPNGGSTAIVDPKDLTALAVGDDVSGIGIADESYITEITGTTIEISDAFASGSIATNFTNDGDFIRGGTGSGIGQKDAFQGHVHFNGVGGCNDNWWIYGNVPTDTPGNAIDNVESSGAAPIEQGITSDPEDNSVNGLPRISKETRPKNRTTVYIMRIK